LHCVGDVAQRHRPHRRAALAGGDQRPDEAGVLGVRGHDLVAGAELHPRDHPPEPLAGRRLEREVGGIAAEHLRVQRPQLALDGEAGVEVRAMAPVRELRLERLARGPHRRRRHRPVRPRVQECDALEDGELGAEGGGVHGGGAGY
jgi:hypothetical protein